MQDNPTREEVLKSIVPDSTQINAEDFTGGPQTFTISGVRRGNKEQPIQIDLVECDRAYRPCKSMRRVLIATFSDDPTQWVGQQMTLYCDPTVMWAGVEVGGIRISHLSGLSEPRSYMLTKARGKRSEVVIHPIAALVPEHRAWIDNAMREIAAADSLDALNLIGNTLIDRPNPVQEALRPEYAKRLKELKQAEPE